jgi:conjugative relaxase-like TrwC/TraI family protein
LWAVADEDLREKIQAAHDAAVRAAIAGLEAHTAPLRRRVRSTGKIVPERTAGLVVAEVRHHSARPVKPTGDALSDLPDPQLHTHALVMNMARRVTPDGKRNEWGAIDSRALLTAQKESGKVYGTALAAELSKLGFGIERRGDAIGVAGISEKLVQEFSRRHAEIETARNASAAEKGRALTAAERHAQVLATRRPKGEPSPGRSLVFGWQVRLAEQGAGPNLPERLLAAEAKRRSLAVGSKGRAAALDPSTPVEVVAAAIAELSESKGTWSWQELRTALAAHAQGQLSPSALDELLSLVDQISGSPASAVVPLDPLPVAALSVELVPTRSADGKPGLTSQTVLDRDRKCLALVEEIRGMGPTVIPPAIARRESLTSGSKVLTDEQNEAARKLFQSRVSVLEAPPGTGKSVVARAVAEQWHRAVQGSSEFPTVWATALAGKAASDLGDGLGALATVRTLDSLQRETLRANDLVIVDEASMVDQARWLPLLSRVRDAGCRLVLVGDRHQQGAVSGPGGLFAHLADEAAERGELATINTNYRALDASDGQAWDAIREGRSTDFLSRYRAQGRICLELTVEEARAEAVADWLRDTIEGKTSLIVATGSNREIDEINKACQAALVVVGQIAADGPSLTITYRDPLKGYEREETLREGDRVALTHTSYLDTAGDRQRSTRSRVHNGESLTIAGIEGSRVTLKRSSGSLVEVADDRVNRLRLDYACSSLRSQGRTVDRSRVMFHPQTDQEAGYVAVTRAREGSWVYGAIRELTDWPDGVPYDTVVEQAMAALATSFSRSRQDELSIVAAERAREAAPSSPEAEIVPLPVRKDEVEEPGQSSGPAEVIDLPLRVLEPWPQEPWADGGRDLDLPMTMER